MSQNKNRKSKYKNNDTAKEQKVNPVITESEEELDEADRILQELDEMEERKTPDISSKVRDLIKNDKEAIRDYNTKIEPDIAEVEEDNKEISEDEMDYLDDEEVVQEQDNRKDTDSQKQRNNKKRKNNKKKTNQYTEEDTEIIDTKEEPQEEDFLASLDKRTEQIVNDKIRKNQPNRLKTKKESNEESHIFVSTIRNLAMSGIKNMIVMVSIIGLLLILVATMILDRNNTGTEKERGSFLKMDTAKIISLNNDYYAALGNGDITKVREYLENNAEISDEVLLEKVDEAKVYKEYIADDFKITSCYLQSGLEKNEYVAHYKFELKIKNVETPAVGMFTGYLINVSEDENNPKYEICNLNADSKRYQYMIKMSQCSNVTKLFTQTDKELDEACEKDEKLKKVVEALKTIGEKQSEYTTTTSETGSSIDPAENTTEAMTE